MLETKRTAIVYDWFDKWGGVERVLLTLRDMFPIADFYTSYYDPNKAPWAKKFKIKTSFIQNLPELIRSNRKLSLVFYPYAFESFDFRDYDLVISVSSSFAKAIITLPGTKHINYLLTPTRFLWSHEKDYIKKGISRDLIGGYFEVLKDWDRVSAWRPDKIVSISKTVKKRCKKYYGRESDVIYPPFDVDYWGRVKSEFRNSKRETNSKYFLIVSRLEPYKKIDLAIKVFNKSNKTLVIVGTGSEEEKLRKLAGKNITFVPKLTDSELASYYSEAEALIMPQEEDFGFVSLEAQFFGCPVISYQKGGAHETIIDEKTGIFFASQTVTSIREAVERFDKIKYNLKSNIVKLGVKNTQRFTKESFIKQFKEIL